ncbi:MAG: hypothetical protein FJY65_01205 [Calditrichaeota bacterium]|nr:hypothetical protein [Calditrichota bacterium]
MPQIYRKDNVKIIAEKIADNIAKHNPDKYLILTEPDTEHFPIPSDIKFDIALIDKAASNLISVILVETESSLSYSHAQQVWLPIVERQIPLEIAAPKSKLKQAKTLAKRLSIHIKVLEY